MTTKQFKVRAEQMFQRANPGATIVKWTHGPVRTINKGNGDRCMCGVFYATQEGYRSRHVTAHMDSQGFGVR
jgi:hypothetical protein